MCQLGSGPAILLWSQCSCRNRDLEMDSVTLLPLSLRHHHNRHKLQSALGSQWDLEKPQQKQTEYNSVPEVGVPGRVTSFSLPRSERNPPTLVNDRF